jgi:hypothetical protein
LALAFTYETYSYQLSKDFSRFETLMTQAFTNQFWDLMDKYGNAGGLIYAGTMQTLNVRVGTLFNDIDSYNLKTNLEQNLWSSGETIISKSERSRA